MSEPVPPGHGEGREVDEYGESYDPGAAMPGLDPHCSCGRPLNRVRGILKTYFVCPEHGIQEER